MNQHMPIHKSYKKTMQLDIQRRLKNRSNKHYMRTMLKSELKYISEDQAVILRVKQSVIDKAYKKGVISTGQRDRYKSRLYNAHNTR